MNPTSWLEALSASFPRHESLALQVREYLQELKTWVLTDDQWLAIKSLAKRRHTFFPSISELEEIMREVRRDRVPGNVKDGSPSSSSPRRTAADMRDGRCEIER